MREIWMVCLNTHPAKQADAIFWLWRAQGYKIAVQMNLHSPSLSITDRVIFEQWTEMYSEQELESLARRTFDWEGCRRPGQHDACCDWVVCASDCIRPDLHKKAGEIALECSTYFHRLHYGNETRLAVEGYGPLDTLGVMQPTEDPNYVWIGHEAARRFYGAANEPFVTHGSPSELAKRMGILWERYGAKKKRDA